MSAKGAHVQDSSVLERRLRPIYDWLDVGNYKKAIQECEKVLKKCPNLDRARALKALSLLRLGKESECVTILDSLIAQTPCDDAILQAMTMCYRELQQLDRICKLYESAVKADPTNEELHTHLFMSYVRTSDFKQQQQAAMTLYKLTPKSPYYCWAVMSAILQATRGDGSKDVKKRSLLLSLAERMIDKLMQENKLEAEQEAQLYVMVLDEQQKYDRILQILEGPLGSILSGDNIQNKLPYLIKLNKWSDVNILCKKTLSESMDRWDVWRSYITSVFELYSNQQNNHDSNHETQNDESELETVDDTPEKSHEFICKLVESGAENGYVLRGPYLARFELCKQLGSKGKNASGDSTDLLGDIMELFMEYFRKFGHKPCSVSDLRNYLDLLDDERRLDLSGRLIKDVGISSTSVPQSELQMQRHICALQLSRLCGSHLNLPTEHLRALVTAFSYHYLHGHQTYGQNLLSTDQAPADAYTLLAAHLLYDLYRKTESSQPLLLSLVLLKHTLKNSPSNFHLKLLALRVYHILGCCLGAQVLYDSLDIKHLQLDSMCYIHCAHLAKTGHYTLATSLFDSTLKFFSTNYKDSSDHLTFSYKFGSFLKLTEFMDFRERLNNSFHYTSTAVDRLFLSVVQCATTEQIHALETSPRDDPVDWNGIRNNSDLSVYISWDPDRIKGPIEDWPESKTINEQDVETLKLRVAILNCVQAALQVFKSPSDVKTAAEQLQQELGCWEKLREDVAMKKYQPVDQRLLCMPLPSRLHSHLSTPYSSVLVPIFQIVMAITTEDIEKCEQASDTGKNEYAVMIRKACEVLKSEENTTDVYLQRRKNIEYLCNIIEISSIVSMLSILCLELFKSSQGGGGKKTKKKSWDAKIKESVMNLVTVVREETGELDSALKTCSEELETKNMPASMMDELSEKLSALNLCGDVENSVVNTLVKSHGVVLKEFRTVLKNKLRLLNVS